jgi:hypothetical protein
MHSLSSAASSMMLLVMAASCPVSLIMLSSHRDVGVMCKAKGNMYGHYDNVLSYRSLYSNIMVLQNGEGYSPPNIFMMVELANWVRE